MEQNNGNPLENTKEQTEVCANKEEQTEVGKKGKKQKLTGKARVLKEIREWVVALVAAVLIVVVIQSFLFRIIRVEGQSMADTLQNGERLFVTVTDVKFGDVDRDTVVICHYPGRMHNWFGLFETKEYFVKRVVAVPGDTIYRESDVTHVVYEQDGQTVDVALDERMKDSAFFRSLDYEPYVLGEDEYFVVGDNRYNSHDSRDWDGPGVENGGGNDYDTTNNVGPIGKDMIVGRVREVIWPLNNIRPVE